jgi:hypothetical protein
MLGDLPFTLPANHPQMRSAGGTLWSQDKVRSSPLPARGDGEFQD